MKIPRKSLLPGIFLVLISARAAADTKVFFFGGHAASSAQMKCWAQGAKESPRGQNGMSFEGIPYPIESTNPVAAADSAAGREAIDRIVREIDNGPKDRVYVIAGHSSGGKLAGRVAEKVKNPQQVKLVILDGSRPSEAAKKRVSSTTCYVPRGTRPFNQGSMESCADMRSIPAERCRGNATCGHFALVNAEVMPGLRSYRADGYRRAGGGAGCRPNLDWVPVAAPLNTKYRPAVAGVTRDDVEGTR